MAQFARPDGNVTQTSFTGGFAEIDEATPSDTDFAYGANNTAAELEISLSNPTDPQASTGHTFRYRIAKTNAGTVDGGGSAVTVTARLMQGTTQIATDTAKTANGTWTQYEYTLSAAEADAITDYTDLRLEFVTSASGGSPANRRGGAVSWAELEVPNAAVGFSLDAQPGNFGLTGSAAGAVAQRTVAALPAAYSLTGVVSSPVAGRIVTGSPGTYAVSGTDAATLSARVLAALPGSYDYAGFNAELVPPSTGFEIDAQPGSYVLSGAAAGTTAGRSLFASPAVFSVTGADGTVLAGRIVNAAAGAVAVTGAAATFYYGAGADYSATQLAGPRDGLEWS